LLGKLKKITELNLAIKLVSKYVRLDDFSLDRNQKNMVYLLVITETRGFNPLFLQNKRYYFLFVDCFQIVNV